MNQITVYVGQVDEIEVKDIRDSAGELVDFNALGITKISLVIPGLKTLSSDTDAIELDASNNKIKIIAGHHLTGIVNPRQSIARLVEHRNETDSGRTLLDGLLINIQP